MTPLAIAVPPFQSTADGYIWLRLLSTLLSVRPSSLSLLDDPPQKTKLARRHFFFFCFFVVPSENRPANDLEFALFAPAVGAVTGCWSGAVPIPLDWDRPWQVRHSPRAPFHSFIMHAGAAERRPDFGASLSRTRTFAQKYPTTCIVGAIAGHAAGSVVSLGIVSYRAAVRAASRALKERESLAAEEGAKKKKNKAPAKGRAKSAAAAASRLKNK